MGSISGVILAIAGLLSGMYWVFLVAAKPRNTFCLVRDCEGVAKGANLLCCDCRDKYDLSYIPKSSADDPRVLRHELRMRFGVEVDD